MTNKNNKTKLILFWLDKLVKGKCTVKQAAESTGYNTCYMSQLKKKYIMYGPECLVHGNKDKIPHNKTPEETINRILSIYSQPEYEGCNFKLFQESLEEDYNITVSYNTLRSIMMDAGIKSPKRHKIKVKDKTHLPRPRRANEGDLIQLDGTPYEWFKLFGDNKKYCLHGAIDDATSKITAFYMTQNECLYGVMKLFEITALRHGLPREAYMDRAAWACVTPRLKNCLSITEQLSGIHEKRTQVQRAMYDLNINQVLAWSPQAKGRVERMWTTVQDRLPLWLFKHGYDTMDKFNAHIGEFIDYLNKRFSRPAASENDFWRPAPEDISEILCARFRHKTNINGVFKFHSYQFAITECPFVANKYFDLCVSADGLMAQMDNGNYYPVKLLDDDLGYVIGDTMPEVVKNIIYENLFTFAKEVSA